MGDLSQTRIGSIERLLEQAPDSAVHSLLGLLSQDDNSDAAISAIRGLIDAEAGERRLRSAVFAPLAPLFRPPARTPRLSLPPRTPEVLWRALKRQAPEAVRHASEVAVEATGEAAAAFDVLCSEAALILEDAADAELAEFRANLASPGDANTLATLLRLAPILRRSVARLPAWLLDIGGEHGAAVRLAYRDAEAVSEEGGALLVETLFAHMDESPQILRLISAIMDRPTERYLAASELKRFGERLLDDMDMRIETVRRFDPRRGLEAGVAVASAAEDTVAALVEFERQIVLSKEGVWGARIGALRRGLALVMEMRLREVEPAIQAALPMHATRQGGGRLKAIPAMTVAPDSMAVDRGFALLALLEGCRSAASVGGFAALRAKVVEALDAWLDAYAEDLLELLRRPGSDRDRVHAYLEVAAEFTALVRDPDAARIVRRRAAAA